MVFPFRVPAKPVSHVIHSEILLSLLISFNKFHGLNNGAPVPRDIWAQGDGQEPKSEGLHTATVQHHCEILLDKVTAKLFL